MFKPFEKKNTRNHSTGLETSCKPVLLSQNFLSDPVSTDSIICGCMTLLYDQALAPRDFHMFVGTIKQALSDTGCKIKLRLSL